MERAFWRALAAVRKSGGISTNEIARRLDAAGLASRPTTLARLSAITVEELGEDLSRVHTRFREIAAAVERSGPVVRQALAEAADEPEE